MTIAALSVKDAAAEIIALINSQAQSPWLQGVEAIIAKAVTPALLSVEVLAPPSCDAALSAEHMEYRQVVAQFDRFNDPEYSAGSEQEHEASTSKRSASRERRSATTASQMAAGAISRAQAADPRLSSRFGSE